MRAAQMVKLAKMFSSPKFQHGIRYLLHVVVLPKSVYSGRVKAKVACKALRSNDSDHISFHSRYSHNTP